MRTDLTASAEVSSGSILLRMGKSGDPQHAAISHALHVLVGQGMRLCYTSQTLAGFKTAAQTNPSSGRGDSFPP